MTEPAGGRAGEEGGEMSILENVSPEYVRQLEAEVERLRAEVKRLKTKLRMTTTAREIMAEHRLIISQAEAEERLAKVQTADEYATGLALTAENIALKARLAKVREEVLREVRDVVMKYPGEPIGRLGAYRILKERIADFPVAYAAAQPEEKSRG